MPKYKKIYEDLLMRIRSEEFKKGDILPKEFDLMKEYGVSRDTIRKSLRLLSDEGFIHANKGVGSIVLDCNRFELPISGIKSFKELNSMLGSNIVTKVIRCELSKPDNNIKEKLNLVNGQNVWIVERVRMIYNENIILDLDYFNADIITDLTIDIAKDSIYEYIENKLNLKISYANKEFTCQNVNSKDKKLLDMKGYDLVVNVDSYTYLSDTKIFQFTRSRHRPDKFRFNEFAKR